MARNRKPRRDRRRWTGHLSEDVPAGPQGQPAHAAGAEFAVIDLIDVPDVGAVSLSVPKPSALLLRPASAHLHRASRLRRTAASQVGRGRWVQPGFELKFTNEQVVYDFLEEAMAGIVLAHAALDNALNELLPPDFEFTDEKGERWSAERIEGYMGLERRLTQVAAAATGRPNLRSVRPELVAEAIALKKLRDDIGHARRDRTYGGPNLLRTVFSDLFAYDLERVVGIVEDVSEHYGSPLPTTDATGGGARA